MKDIFKPGLFEPRIKPGKELAVMEKYNPYSGIKVQIGYTPSTPYKTVFRIAEKGIVFEGLNDGGSDIRIPWSEIAGVSANESIIWSLTMVLKLKDGTDCHIFFGVQYRTFPHYSLSPHEIQYVFLRHFRPKILTL